MKKIASAKKPKLVNPNTALTAKAFWAENTAVSVKKTINPIAILIAKISIQRKCIVIGEMLEFFLMIFPPKKP